jgi:hypothetical protein
MALQLFDLDYDLKEDPNTKDFKELYNEEAVNQSIDIWISMPYRVGQGYTNSIISRVFTDLNYKEIVDFQRDIATEFERNYPMLQLINLKVTPDTVKRYLYVSLSWKLVKFDLYGQYTRYWRT